MELRDKNGKFAKGHTKPQEMLIKIGMKIKGRKHTEDVKKRIGGSIKELNKSRFNRVGERVGRLIVISKLNPHIKSNGKKASLYLCQCDCGQKTQVLNDNLKSGHTRSCGCLSKENQEKNKFKKGSRLTESAKENLRRINTGKRHSKETVMKMKARRASPETLLKMRASARKGPLSHLWKGGITNVVNKIRSCFEYKQWTKSVLLRDKFICQWCGDHNYKGRGISVKFEVHHIKPFSLIVEQYKIRSYEQSVSCHELWDTSNGTTLCKSCHKKTLPGRPKKKNNV